MFFKDIESLNGEFRWAEFFLTIGRLFGKEVLDSCAVHSLFLQIPYSSHIPHILALGIADSIYQNASQSLNYSLEDSLHSGTTIYYRSDPRKAEVPCTFIKFNERGNPVIQDMKKNPTTITVGRDWKNQIRIANEQVTYKKSRKLDEKLMDNLKNHYPVETLNYISKMNKHNILIIGNATKLKNESESLIQDLPIYNWILLDSYIHPQLFSLTTIYSSKYKDSLKELTKNTIIIYTNLEAYILFQDELKDFSNIILFSPIEELNISEEALMMITNNLDSNPPSDLIDENLLSRVPKGVAIASWKMI